LRTLATVLGSASVLPRPRLGRFFLFGLSVQSVAAFARAVLAELESAGVVFLVLASGVRPHFALAAGELDDWTGVDFCHGFTR